MSPFGSCTTLWLIASPTFFRMGGETNLFRLFLYLIEISPLLLNRGWGPILELSSEFSEVSRRCGCSYNYLDLFPAMRLAKFDMLLLILFGDFNEFFVISDSSLAEFAECGDGCRDEALLTRRIFLTVLFEAEDITDESEITGPFSCLRVNRCCFALPAV